ncbi:MAG: sulfurtransferase [Cyclobacteriaceae bacterium]
MSPPSPLIEAEELQSILHHADLVLVDASAGPGARERYAQNHLPGALYADLESDLSGDKSDLSQGGRHPLPGLKVFLGYLASLGISSNSHVVVYDDKSGANAASRFWWMLRAIGHSNVQVLNGGLPAAVKAGIALTDKKITTVATAQRIVDSWQLPLADIEEVEDVSHDQNHLVIDVRDKFRYDGESEPIDLIAGHIPGATNIPFSENLDKDGKYLSKDELKEKYTKALAGKPIENTIVHCGSGVTACHTILTMAYAGFEIPKLYIGSWSEWSRTNRPMVTKKK